MNDENDGSVQVQTLSPVPLEEAVALLEENRPGAHYMLIALPDGSSNDLFFSVYTSVPSEDVQTAIAMTCDLLHDAMVDPSTSISIHGSGD